MPSGTFGDVAAGSASSAQAVTVSNPGGTRSGKVTFRSGQRPNGRFEEPSGLLLADKAEFGTSRIRRWFGRDWTSY